MSSCLCMVFLGFGFIVGQLAVGEFTTRCYNINNYRRCWSTDGTLKTWTNASNSCRARNSTLLSVTSNEIQSVLRDFRTNVTSIYSAYDINGMWLNVTTGILDSFHWIDGTTGYATAVSGQFNDTRRFAVIMLEPSDKKTVVYRAFLWNDLSYYICQFNGSDVDCTFGFRKNVVCYLKYNSETVTWFTASNRCLSMGGFLATFNDLTTPSDDISLTTWSNLSPSVKYWVGLVRRWYTVEQPGGLVTDVQYTNWDSTSPRGPDGIYRCVLLRNDLQWSDAFSCADVQRFACQTIMPIPESSTGTTTTTSSSSSLLSSSSTTTGRLAAPTSSTTSVTVDDEHSTKTTDHLPPACPASPTTVTTCRSSPIIGLAVGLGVSLVISIVINVVLVKLFIFPQKSSRAETSQGSNPERSSAPELVTEVPLYTSLSNQSPPGDAAPIYTQLHGNGHNLLDDSKKQIEYEDIKC